MKLIVFGGTGQTGSAVLKLGTQQQDLEITAFVRSPSKIPNDVKSKLHDVIVGDVMNPKDVGQALVGQEAVISCLGTSIIKGTPRLASQGIEHVVNGMRKNGVKKLALVAGASAFPVSPLSFVWRKVGEDHQRVISFLRTAEDVDWTVLMAPFISKSTEGGSYKTSIGKLPGGKNVRTYDLADWLLSCIQDDIELRENTHKLVGISSNFPESGLLTPVKLAVLCLVAAIVIAYFYYV